jgi:hypothetical protein
MNERTVLAALVGLWLLLLLCWAAMDAIAWH